MKTITAYWKSKNPFMLDVNQLSYTKTVTVPDDVDMEKLKDFAESDSKDGYVFDKFKEIE